MTIELRRHPVIAMGLALSVGAVGLVGIATPAAATGVAASRSAARGTAWFHDPLTAAQRRAEIAVPAVPAGGGPLQATTALFRTHAGSIAVPVSWAVGHVLVRSQALSLTAASLFDVDSAHPTAAARAEISGLRTSLRGVRAITCEGYTDFGFNATNEQQLSAKRAQAVCGLVSRVAPGLATTAVGYGGTEPAVVGGRSIDRSANRRVVIVVTAAAALPTTPAAPRLTGARPGRRSATITFAAPARTGGAAITSYQVSRDAGRSWRPLAVHGAGPWTVTLTGMRPGTTYRVAVRALNAVGPSPRSNVRPVTPAAAPAAPRLLAAVGGNGTAVVTFAAPPRRPGAPLTGYQLSTDRGRSWLTVGVNGPGPYPVVVAGLTNGVTYRVVVRAVGPGGTSPASNTLSVTPGRPAPRITVPSAPQLLRALPGNGTASIAFSPPAATGGSPILGYQVSTDGGHSWVAITATGSHPYLATIGGLTNGVRYAVEVRALNRAGHGPASAVRSVTPATVPAAPDLTSVDHAPDSLTLNFAAPTSDGGSLITGYQASLDGGNTWADITTTGSSPFTVEIDGLEFEQTYDVSVRAVNDLGAGSPSNSVSATTGCSAGRGSVRADC